MGMKPICVHRASIRMRRVSTVERAASVPTTTIRSGSSGCCGASVGAPRCATSGMAAISSSEGVGSWGSAVRMGSSRGARSRRVGIAGRSKTSQVSGRSNVGQPQRNASTRMAIIILPLCK